MSWRPARGMPVWVPALTLLPVLLRGALPRALGAAAALGCLAFFRDPDRRAAGPGVVAAADGKIREVAERDGRWVVSTYLSLLDVHVTRAAWPGVVTGQVARAGGHRPAFAESSHGNQSVSWSIDSDAGSYELVQYAGLLARRIVPYLGVGGRCERGGRIGLIRFGSRVDVLLPAGFHPVVAVGDKVRGGHTVVAVAAAS